MKNTKTNKSVKATPTKRSAATTTANIKQSSSQTYVAEIQQCGNTARVTQVLQMVGVGKDRTPRRSNARAFARQLNRSTIAIN